MFKKTLTTVHSNGVVDVPGEPLNVINASEVQADMAAEVRNIRQMTRTYGRVSAVEQTMTTLVIIYTSGTVEIFQWVAE
jgi:hypothetical protein